MYIHMYICHRKNIAAYKGVENAVFVCVYIYTCMSHELSRVNTYVAMPTSPGICIVNLVHIVTVEVYV